MWYAAAGSSVSTTNTSGVSAGSASIAPRAASTVRSSLVVNAGDCLNHPNIETATKATTAPTAIARWPAPRWRSAAAPTAPPMGTKNANCSSRFGGPQAVIARRTTPPAVTAAQESHSANRKRSPPPPARPTGGCAAGRPPATARPTPVTTGTAARDRSPQKRSR
jgi:hypothetical protein